MTDKEKVLAVWPNAKCRQWGTYHDMEYGWTIWTDRILSETNWVAIGGGTTPELAWADAASKLPKQEPPRHAPLQWGENCSAAPDRGPHECAGDDATCLREHKHVCCRCGDLCPCRLCNLGNPRVQSSISMELVHTDTPLGRTTCIAQPIQVLHDSEPVIAIVAPRPASEGDGAGEIETQEKRQSMIDPVERNYERVVADSLTERDNGWLIEKGQLCLGTDCGKPAWVTFTNDGAIRFARWKDADLMLSSLMSFDANAFLGCTISEHAWPSPTPPATGVSEDDIPNAGEIFGVVPYLPIDAVQHACGILDVVKGEWGDSWSEHDQKVRAGLSAILADDLRKRIAPNPPASEGDGAGEKEEEFMNLHIGDPCIFCGVGHDKVQSGPCPRNIITDERLAEIAKDVKTSAILRTEARFLVTAYQLLRERCLAPTPPATGEAAEDFEAWWNDYMSNRSIPPFPDKASLWNAKQVAWSAWHAAPKSGEPVGDVALPRIGIMPLQGYSEFEAADSDVEALRNGGESYCDIAIQFAIERTRRESQLRGALTTARSERALRIEAEKLAEIRERKYQAYRKEAAEEYQRYEVRLAALAAEKEDAK